MVGKAAEQGHVSGLSWIESIDARPIAAWAARKALHRLRAAGSNDMAGARAPPPFPIVRRYIRDFSPCAAHQPPVPRSPAATPPCPPASRGGVLPPPPPPPCVFATTGN